MFKNRLIPFFRLYILVYIPILLLISCNNNIPEGDRTIMTESKNPPNPYYSRTDTTRLDLPDSVWKKILPDDVYAIARQKGTERPYTGKYWDATGNGIYYCAACGNPLFRSTAWFASSCGWPSFFEVMGERSVAYHSDTSHGMQRTEVVCGRCGAHLGHIFDDGPQPTGQRYCINSASLNLDASSS